jgi:calcineurin-like phosphoesterase family protein
VTGVQTCALPISNIWLTSDTHYSHSNICLGTTKWDTSTEKGLDAVRKFPDLETMNNLLVDNINDNVQENDWLIHDGDWSFGGFEKIEEFRSKINCKNIILIPGNHDHHIINNKDNIRKIFNHVNQYEELELTSNKIKSKLVLCHYPIISWNSMRKGTYMLHGHQHLKNEDRFGEGKRMDIGIDGSPEFRPYHIDEIVLLLEGRDNNTHH